MSRLVLTHEAWVGRAVIGRCPTEHLLPRCRSRSRFSGAQIDSYLISPPSWENHGAAGAVSIMACLSARPRVSSCSLSSAGADRRCETCQLATIFCEPCRLAVETRRLTNVNSVRGL